MRPLRLRLLAAAAVLAATAGSAVAASPEAERRVVRGSDGYLFIAQDWSVPCRSAGQARATTSRMAALVAAVERSGRDATVVLGPDKATLRTGNVPRTVPHGACGLAEKAAVWEQAHERLGPDLLDLRRHLADAGARWQLYWRQDTHWTPTAGTVYARQLAARLDLVLARRLQLVPEDTTRRGDLAEVLGIPGTERVSGVRLVNPDVEVTEHARGDAGVGHGSRRFTATPTTATGRVVPGRTLFLGDSFDATVAAQLAPLFEESVFLWPDPDVPAAVLRDRVAAADRVVVMRVERFSSQWRPYDADVVRALATLPPR